MSNIRARPRKDGSVGYTARVRIRAKGEVIHQEIQTFSTKAVAEKWAKRREVELEDPKELEKARQGATTLASLIRWYIDSFKNVSKWQRSKQSALLFLEKHEIGTVDALTLTTQRVVEHVRARRASGVGGSTAANDLIWLSIILQTAKAAQGLPVKPQVIDEARIVCHRLRLISRSKRRERRPTNEELQKLDQFFAVRDRHPSSLIPMRTLMWFAIESARREAEICRLETDDNDPNGRTGLVRDAKHPRHKEGNHLRFKYTPRGWEIVQHQPRLGRYIFPYDPKSVSVAFTEACKMLGIVDLRFHDLRHEATSRLFELGYAIHEVAQFTLHRSWDELKRYANTRPENLREIVVLATGERIVRPASVQTQMLLSPPPAELAPPNTRLSRSPLFAEERIARRRRRLPRPIVTVQPSVVATLTDVIHEESK